MVQGLNIMFTTCTLIQSWNDYFMNYPEKHFTCTYGISFTQLLNKNVSIKWNTYMIVSYDFCKGGKKKKKKNLFSMSTESFHMSSRGNEKQNRGERMI